MRWSLVVGSIVIAGAALADPIPDLALYDKTQSDDAAVRADAASQLAKRIAKGRGRAIELAQSAAISDDPKVRGPLLEALIAAKHLDKPTAAQVPTASVLRTKVGQLLPKVKPDELPTAQDCRVTGGTARGATLECRTLVCRNGCVAEHHTYAVMTGVRWSLRETPQKRRPIDDGSCGFCE